MKKILILVAVGAVIAAGAVYFVYNKPHRDVAAEEAKFTLTANQLFDEFEADEAASNSKYLDQTVEVSGEIAELGVNDAGQAFVILVAENAMIGGVSATFGGEQAGLEIGKNVSLKCRCTGKLMDVVLINCTVLE